MPFEWSDDIEQTRWWTERLHPFAMDVGSVIPDVFEAYARVFHPVDDGGRARTWAAIAAENGRIVHAEMQLHEIARPVGAPRRDGDARDGRVRWGSLPTPELQTLSGLLAHHTSTPDLCWCCVWEGYGQLHGSPSTSRLAVPGHTPDLVPPLVPAAVLGGPRVEIPNRAYFLLHGSLHDLTDLVHRLGGQSPNLWWPDDRAWCVSTEIDFAWTYVGGTDAAVDSVLTEPRLETLPAEPTDRFTSDSDALNAALDA